MGVPNLNGGSLYIQIRASSLPKYSSYKFINKRRAR